MYTSIKVHLCIMHFVRIEYIDTNYTQLLLRCRYQEIFTVRLIFAASVSGSYVCHAIWYQFCPWGVGNGGQRGEIFFLAQLSCKIRAFC